MFGSQVPRSVVLEGSSANRELWLILKQQLAKVSGTPSFLDAISPELEALLSLAIFRVGIWDNNATYGDYLFQVSMVQPSSLSPLSQLASDTVVPARGGLSKRTKLLYCLLTIGVRYLVARCRLTCLNANWDLFPVGSWQRRFARAVGIVERLLRWVAALSMLAFLVTSGPLTAADRLLAISRGRPAEGVGDVDGGRATSLDMLSRQVMWVVMGEAVAAAAPVVAGLRALVRPRRTGGVSNDAQNDAGSSPSDAAAPDDARRSCGPCVVCGASMVVAVCLLPCRHVACYACVATAPAGPFVGHPPRDSPDSSPVSLAQSRRHCGAPVSNAVAPAKCPECGTAVDKAERIVP